MASRVIVVAINGAAAVAQLKSDTVSESHDSRKALAPCSNLGAAALASS